MNAASKIIAAIAFAAALGANIAATIATGRASLDHGIVSNELPHWSSERVVSQLIHLDATAPDVPVISTSLYDNIAPFEQASFSGRPLFFFSDVSRYNPFAKFNINGRLAGVLGNAAFRAELQRRIIAHDKLWIGARYAFDSGRLPDQIALDSRIAPVIAAPKGAILLQSFNPTLFNNWRRPGEYDGVIRATPYRAAHDILVAIPSQLSTGTYIRFEPDVFDRSKNIMAVERYRLFHVVNPSRRMRIVVDYTATIQRQNDNLIPPLAVYGTTTAHFHVAGRGAMRLVSDPVTPVVLDGLPFIELDMGRDGRAFPEHRTGVMRLFGTEIPFDTRRPVGFIRDISAISDDEYAALDTPSELETSVKALENPNLEFSGIYEDGYIADAAEVVLRSPPGAIGLLVVEATVPREATAMPLRITVTIDGRGVYAAAANAGAVRIAVPAAADGRRHRIRIGANHTFILPNGDGRSASIDLHSISLE